MRVTLRVSSRKVDRQSPHAKSHVTRKSTEALKHAKSRNTRDERSKHMYRNLVHTNTNRGSNAVDTYRDKVLDFACLPVLGTFAACSSEGVSIRDVYEELQYMTLGSYIKSRIPTASGVQVENVPRAGG